MATWLPLRSFNRSQNVRIDAKKIVPTTSKYIDIADATTRKEFGYHSAIGSVYATDAAVNVTSGTVIAHGGVITTGTATGNSSVTSTVSETSVLTSTTAVDAPGVSLTTTLTGLTSGKSIVVFVEVDNTTGVISAKTGTAATTGSETAPTVTSGATALGKFTVAYGNTIGSVTDLRSNSYTVS
jgi:hypothetical protein